jgi:hypothetical protein
MIHAPLFYKNRTISSVLTATSVEVYVTPNQYEGHIASLLFSNSGGAAAVTLVHYDKILNTNFTILGSYSVPAYGVFQLENAMWLAKGDKLFCSSVSALVSLTLVVKELYSPQTF